MRSAADLAAINTELTTDPNGNGYLPHAADNDGENAKRLNAERDTISISVDSVDAGEVWAAIDDAEFAALHTGDERQLTARLSSPTVVLRKGSETKQFLRRIFPQGSATLPKLRKLWSARSSRANEMFREDGTLEVGGRITASDVADSRG